MNNTLKYTIAAAIVIAAAAFGIQMSIKKPIDSAAEVTTLSPAAGEVSTDQITQEAVDAVIQAGAPVESVEPVTDNAAVPPQPAPVEGAIEAIQEPAAGTPETAPVTTPDQPAAIPPATTDEEKAASQPSAE